MLPLTSSDNSPLNGVAVQVRCIDPATGQQQIWQETREHAGPLGLYVRFPTIQKYAERRNAIW